MAVTKQELEQWLTKHNYIRDSFGHYRKQLANGLTYRFKLSSISARYEVKEKIVDHNEWIRLQSGYYKDLSITSDYKLAGLKR